MDLTGYTRLTEERGDRFAADIAGGLLFAFDSDLTAGGKLEVDRYKELTAGSQDLRVRGGGGVRGDADRS